MNNNSERMVDFQSKQIKAASIAKSTNLEHTNIIKKKAAAKRGHTLSFNQTMGMNLSNF